MALRDWGAGAGLALVSTVPSIPPLFALGESVHWNPPWSATDVPPNIPVLSSSKNVTGAPL